MGGTRINRVCPVHGCGARLARCSGKPRSLPPNFTLQLDSSIDAAVNGKVCTACYVRHIRLARNPTASTASSHHSSLDELAMTAVAELSTPPSLLHSASPSPLLLSTSPSISPQSLTYPPRPLCDITNTPTKQRRHSTPLKRKRELVEGAVALSSPDQRKQFYASQGADSRLLRRYAEAD